MSGCGLSTDGTSLFFETGNGSFDANNPGGTGYGDSFVRVKASDLSVGDFFTPFNQDALNQVDADLGSGGIVLLPDSAGSPAHPHLLIGCGKGGKDLPYRPG